MSAYVCNLIVPGAGKSGTTSLHEILDRHPNIHMSRPKEPQFFSFDDLFKKGPEAHNALFRTGGNIRFYGESSQSYFVHEHAIARICASLDDPKAILLLRDPVERLLSHYRWNYKLAVERKVLAHALEERGLDTSYKFDKNVNMYRERGGYLAFSQYSKYVPQWQEALEPENVLLLRTEDLQRDPSGVAARCFDFLDLPAVRIEETMHKNTTAETTRVSMPWYLSSLAPFVPSRVKNTKRYIEIRQFLKRLMTPTPPKEITPDEDRMIRELLAPDIAFYDALEGV